MAASDWLADAKGRPVPRMLFGEFWLEGELAILFADTGAGKSILAVQIAEAIARGRPIEPLRCTAGPQRVLYFDFELTGKQFEMRYARDAAEGETHLKNHYKFSRNLLRAEVDANAPVAESAGRGFEDLLAERIEQHVRRTGARVLIVDNITYLRSGAVRTGEAIRLMRRLRRLKAELGLSILVLAHTPKRYLRGPITVNDLQGSKMLANFADNIFAIGQSGYDSSHRYIKHIKPRSTEMIYDTTHVPGFAVGKRSGNFLSFTFIGYREEKIHLSTKYDHMRLEKADRMKALAVQGWTQRDIAARFGVSAASVNRYLQMWSPFEDRREEFTRNVEARRRQEEEERLAQARRRREELETDRRAAGDALCAGADYDDPNGPCCDGRDPDCCGRYGIDFEAIRAERSEDPEAAQADPSPPETIHDHVRRLPTGLDNNGNEVFIEQQHPNGQLVVWYRYDRKGLLRKSTRKGCGINCEVLARPNAPAAAAASAAWN